MRQVARVDANQAEIVRQLRDVGFHVLHTHTLGKGAPDLIVTAYHRRLDRVMALFVEVKAPGGKLTDDEMRWHNDFPCPGPLIVAWSVDDILHWFESY